MRLVKFITHVYGRKIGYTPSIILDYACPVWPDHYCWSRDTKNRYHGISFARATKVLLENDYQ